MSYCADCQNAGFVFATPKVKESEELSRSEYVFRCTCSRGRAKVQVGIPLFNDDYKLTFRLFDFLAEAMANKGKSESILNAPESPKEEKELKAQSEAPKAHLQATSEPEALW